MPKILVKCAFTIPVEVPDSIKYDAHFDIEQNHCPGTGLVGDTLAAHMAAAEAMGCCWACALGGTCEIAPQAEGDVRGD